jgi:hypothetical protein
MDIWIYREMKHWLFMIVNPIPSIPTCLLAASPGVVTPFVDDLGVPQGRIPPLPRNEVPHGPEVMAIPL